LVLLLLLLGLVASPLHAEEPQAERTDWHYGTYLDLARLYFASDDWDEGQRLCQEALRLNPKSHEAHACLGEIHHAKGRNREAIAEFKKSIAVKPDYAMAHYNLGTVYRELGRDREALVFLQRAVQHDSAHASARYNLAAAYMDAGRYDEAIPELQAAVKLKPEAADAHKLLALAYYKQGHYDQAIAEGEIALRLDPRNPQILDVHNIVGSAYVHKGDKASAQRVYEHLRSINKEWAQELKQKIDTMP
jgi:tetratricopeptide (TPR) repeat protein